MPLKVRKIVARELKVLIGFIGVTSIVVLILNRQVWNIGFYLYVIHVMFMSGFYMYLSCARSD